MPHFHMSLMLATYPDAKNETKTDRKKVMQNNILQVKSDMFPTFVFVFNEKFRIDIRLINLNLDFSHDKCHSFKI